MRCAGYENWIQLSRKKKDEEKQEGLENTHCFELPFRFWLFGLAVVKFIYISVCNTLIKWGLSPSHTRDLLVFLINFGINRQYVGEKLVMTGLLIFDDNVYIPYPNKG